MDFMNKVRNFLTHDIKVVSSDVDFFITNIPLNGVVDFLERKLSSSLQKIPMPVSCLTELIRLSVTNNVFLLKHISSFAMGVA